MRYPYKIDCFRMRYFEHWFDKEMGKLGKFSSVPNRRWRKAIKDRNYKKAAWYDFEQQYRVILRVFGPLM